MRRPTKTRQIQVRVTPAEKRELERQARGAGLDLSSWLLERALPPRREQFQKLVTLLARATDRSFALAEIGRLLSELGPEELRSATDTIPRVKLDEVTLNLLAAMVELRAARSDVRPPDWTEAVEPLGAPWFPTNLTSVRLELLCHAPAAYRRRNLFVDSTFEAQA